MVKITISEIPYSKVPDIIERLSTIKGIDFNVSRPQSQNVIRKRLDFVKELFLERLTRNGKITLENLYQFARRRGYSMRRKTFTRDISRLEEMNLIKQDVTMGGANGSYSVLMKPHPTSEVRFHKRRQHLIDKNKIGDICESKDMPKL